MELQEDPSAGGNHAETYNFAFAQDAVRIKLLASDKLTESHPQVPLVSASRLSCWNRQATKNYKRGKKEKITLVKQILLHVQCEKFYKLLEMSVANIFITRQFNKLNCESRSANLNHRKQLDEKKRSKLHCKLKHTWNHAGIAAKLICSYLAVLTTLWKHVLQICTTINNDKMIHNETRPIKFPRLLQCLF